MCSEWAGLSLEAFLALNPLLAPQCDTIGLQPGSAVCVGDTIAFCSHVVVASASDTCRSIRREEVGLRSDWHQASGLCVVPRNRSLPNTPLRFGSPALPQRSVCWFTIDQSMLVTVRRARL